MICRDVSCNIGISIKVLKVSFLFSWGRTVNKKNGNAKKFMYPKT